MTWHAECIVSQTRGIHFACPSGKESVENVWKEGVNEWALCLKHSKWTCKISSLWSERAGNRMRLCTGGRDDTWRTSTPCSELQCSAVLNKTLSTANREWRKPSDDEIFPVLIKLPSMQHSRCSHYCLQACNSPISLSRLNSSSQRTLTGPGILGFAVMNDSELWVFSRLTILKVFLSSSYNIY